MTPEVGKRYWTIAEYISPPIRETSGGSELYRKQFPYSAGAVEYTAEGLCEPDSDGGSPLDLWEEYKGPDPNNKEAEG